MSPVFCVQGLPKRLDADLLDRFLETLPSQVDLSSFSQISVTFVTSSQIRVLNRQYRDRDKPTDILTFELPGPEKSMGDLYLCLSQMQDEWDLGSEMKLVLFLLAHGMLHLEGLTHEHEEELQHMISLQKQIVNCFLNQ